MTKNKREEQIKNPRKTKRKKKKNSIGVQMIFVMAVLMAVVFLPTTVLLMIGMLPTPAAFLVDKTAKKIKVLTVGAMNLAGCSPFIIELWRLDNSIETALSIVADPMTIIVMYAAAGMGYVLDWSLKGAISLFLYERGRARMIAIEKTQKDLLTRWGKEVTGKYQMDEAGFALGDDESDVADKKVLKKA